MIHITVFRHDQQIVRLQIEGHALFSDPGQDIVCAAVSVLAITAVNSCEKLLGIEVPAVLEHDKLNCSLPAGLPESVQHDLQLIFASTICGLQDIVEQYPHHVAIKEQTINSK
ncbi:MAG: hypothetical protein JWN30_873 [Bacilli bacterium]|nr:hypothetical protein [Bacilli bacterium]